jgi:hypothetical protein
MTRRRPARKPFGQFRFPSIASGHDVILVKDRDGGVIGIERHKQLSAKRHKDCVSIAVESQML